ncbi:MAG: sugar ABC transporter permease, partial [Planctomycetota bacterium]|nr:sugar ABC transporter permease [Planctomycetota bacterium]
MASMKRERTVGLAFALPWLIGLSLFVLYPFLASFYYSLCDYSVLEGAVWCGAENYRALLEDEVFLMSVRATVLYALLSIPAGIVVS